MRHAFKWIYIYIYAFIQSDLQGYTYSAILFRLYIINFFFFTSM